MKEIVLDTILFDGMYMDIQSIKFKYDPKVLKEYLDKSIKVLEENKFMLSISCPLYSINGISAPEHYDSTSDDEERVTDTDSRIDTQILVIYQGSLYYRGYSKWTADYLEVDLEPILNEIYQ